MLRPSSVLSTLLASGIGVLAAPLRAATPVHWVPVGPPGNPTITALASGKADDSAPLPSRPSLLFAAAAGAAVFRSADAGLSWAATGPGLPGDAAALAVRQVFHMGVDAESYDTTVFAGTSAGGVFRLRPGSSGWTASNTGLKSLDVRALAVGGDGVVRGGNRGLVYAGTANGLFVSADGGDMWVQKTNGLPADPNAAVTALSCDPSSPAVVYAGTTLGLFKTVDAGETWSPLDPAPGSLFYALSVGVDPLAPSRLYADGVAQPPCVPLCLPIAFIPAAYRSLDGGLTWSRADGLGFNFVRSFAATSSLPSRVFAGTAGLGVLQSDDAGVTWTAASDGLGSASVSSVIIDPVLPSFVFAGTSQGVFCAPLGQTAVTCVSGTQAVCLNGSRFAATVSWRDPQNDSAAGRPLRITDNTGAFWFFDPANVELVVKVLDGRSVNGKWWVFYGSLTNVEFTLTVTDTLTGAVRTYVNPQGRMSSAADTSAF